MSQEFKGGDGETAAIREGIVRTRGDMTRTVNAIEERLSPARIEEQVEQLKESVLGNYHEVKDHLKDDISRELREAKEKVKEELLEAKDNVREQIDQARSAVREATVGKVEHMVTDARHMVHDARETVTDAGASVLDTIKTNPIPTALVAVGLGWLIMSARSSTTPSRRGDYDYDYEPQRGPRRMIQQGQRIVGSALHTAEEGVMNAGHRVQEGASAVAHQVGQRATTLTHEVGERVGELAHDVEHLAHDGVVRGREMMRVAGRNARRIERTVESTLHENPLAVGAIALAVGAAIGLALPHTRREDQWMGSMRDRLVDRAEDVAGEALEKIESTVVGQLGSSDQEQEQPQQRQDEQQQAKSLSSDNRNPRNGSAGKNGHVKSSTV